MKGGEERKKESCSIVLITIQIQRESTQYIVPHGQDRVFFSCLHQRSSHLNTLLV